MEIFDAANFYQIGQRLGFADGICSHPMSSGITASQALRETLRLNLTDTLSSCSEIGLRTSEIHCREALLEVEKGDRITHPEVSRIYGELSNTIRREMMGARFFRLSPDKAGFFDKPVQFGEDVSAHFSLADDDITEAGNCLATGRNTAAVFHLVRAMEVGVKAFGEADPE